MSRQVNGVTVQPSALPIAQFGLAQAVTTSDTTPLPDGTRAIYVGGAGNLTVIMANDATNTPVTFNAVSAGTVLQIAAIYIKATGTTATNIVALF